MIILLDKLEDIIDNAPKFLDRAGAIRPDELLELLKKSATVPEEVKRAEMVSRKDRVISKDSSGQSECAQAKEQAARVLKVVAIQAQQEAKQILAEAHQRAQELIKGSEEYAFNVLSELHETLDKTIKVVARGQEELQKDNRNTAAAAAE